MSLGSTKVLMNHSYSRNDAAPLCNTLLDDCGNDGSMIHGV